MSKSDFSCSSESLDYLIILAHAAKATGHTDLYRKIRNRFLDLYHVPESKLTTLDITP